MPLYEAAISERIMKEKSPSEQEKSTCIGIHSTFPMCIHIGSNAHYYCELHLTAQLLHKSLNNRTHSQ